MINLLPTRRDGAGVTEAAAELIRTGHRGRAQHCGHGYAYDPLVEATHLLVAEGADRIVAAADVTNTPMAATFAKAGYPIDQQRIDLSWLRARR